MLEASWAAQEAEGPDSATGSLSCFCLELGPWAATLNGGGGERPHRMAQWPAEARLPTGDREAGLPVMDGPLPSLGL